MTDPSSLRTPAAAVDALSTDGLIDCCSAIDFKYCGRHQGVYRPGEADPYPEYDLIQRAAEAAGGAKLHALQRSVVLFANSAMGAMSYVEMAQHAEWLAKQAAELARVARRKDALAAALSAEQAL